MEIILIAIAVVSNFIFLKYKWEKARFLDFFTDVAVLLTLSYLFAGTATGMIIALVSGMMMSIYLWFWPPHLLNDDVRKSIRESLMAFVPKMFKKTIYV